MSTSGGTILQLTRDDIINAALRKLVVIGEGQSANATQIITATSALNALVAEFRTLGMSLWARKTYQLTPITGQAAYTFGVGQAVNTPYPIKIYNSNMVTGPVPGTQIEMNPLSFMDFSLLPLNSTGTPINYMYQPKINLGVFTVWPTPDSSLPTGSYMSIEYQAPFEYFIAGTDT